MIFADSEENPHLAQSNVQRTPTEKELPLKKRIKELKKNNTKTFTCFGKLPIELRLIIWKLALPGSRTIEVFDFDMHRRTEVPGKVTIICGDGRSLVRRILPSNPIHRPSTQSYNTLTVIFEQFQFQLRFSSNIHDY
jgi:hypothetical protein